MATDPLDPEQTLRKRLTAQLSPGTAADPATPSAAAPESSSAPIPSAQFADTPLSAPQPPTPPNGPWETFNGATWVGGGASGVTPEYGTTGNADMTTGTYSWPAPAPPPLSEMPLPPDPTVGTPDNPQQPIPPDQPVPTEPGHYPTPTQPIPPDQPFPTGPSHPIGTPLNPQQPIPPGQTFPTGPSHPIGGFSPSGAFAAPMLNRASVNTAAGTPQQQLRQRLFSHLSRRRPMGRF